MDWAYPVELAVGAWAASPLVLWVLWRHEHKRRLDLGEALRRERLANSPEEIQRAERWRSEQAKEQAKAEEQRHRELLSALGVPDDADGV